MNISAISHSSLQTGHIYKEQQSSEGFQAALEDAVRKNDARLRAACQGVESYLLQVMYREIRKAGFHTDGFFAKSNAEEIFEDMLYEEYSKIAASRGGIGLAGMMYRQLVRSGADSEKTTN